MASQAMSLRDRQVGKFATSVPRQEAADCRSCDSEDPESQSGSSLTGGPPREFLIDRLDLAIHTYPERKWRADMESVGFRQYGTRCYQQCAAGQ